VIVVEAAREEDIVGNVRGSLVGAGRDEQRVVADGADIGVGRRGRGRSHGDAGVLRGLKRRRKDLGWKCRTRPKKGGAGSPSLSFLLPAMSNREQLLADAQHTRKPLDLAEDVILAFKSGAISSDACGDGAWARANDRAGLREMLGERVGLGVNVWFGVSITCTSTNLTLRARHSELS
jgi:hypothetical protein